MSYTSSNSAFVIFKISISLTQYKNIKDIFKDICWERRMSLNSKFLIKQDRLNFRLCLLSLHNVTGIKRLTYTYFCLSHLYVDTGIFMCKLDVHHSEGERRTLLYKEATK